MNKTQKAQIALGLFRNIQSVAHWANEEEYKGSEKQFKIVMDAADDAIAILTNEIAYEASGSEIATGIIEDEFMVIHETAIDYFENTDFFPTIYAQLEILETDLFMDFTFGKDK